MSETQSAESSDVVEEVVVPTVADKISSALAGDSTSSSGVQSSLKKTECPLALYDLDKVFDWDSLGTVACFREAKRLKTGVFADRRQWAVDQVFYTCDRSAALQLAATVAGDIGAPNNMAFYDDWVTALSFSDAGHHIAIGDRLGRIWIYSTPYGKARLSPISDSKEADDGDAGDLSDASDVSEGGKGPGELRRKVAYEFYGQFQSHSKDFDTLKSIDISPRINCVAWSRTGMNYLTLLAANDKTVKLWKVFEKSLMEAGGESSYQLYAAHRRDWRRQQSERLPDAHSAASELSALSSVYIPSMSVSDVITAAISRRIYAKGHKYQIHSLSVSPDCETFVTSDDMRICLWHVDSPMHYYVLCDKLQALGGDLQLIYETITSAFVHDWHPSMLGYTTSNGSAVVCDLRMKSRIESETEVSRVASSMDSTDASGHSMRVGECMIVRDVQRMRNADYLRRRTFYSEMATALRNGCFTTVSGLEYMVTRDYFAAYTYDLRQTSRPLKRLPLIPYSTEVCRKMYVNDHLFDGQLNVAHSATNQFSLAAGSYGNDLVVYDNWMRPPTAVSAADSQLASAVCAQKLTLADPSLATATRADDSSSTASPPPTSSTPKWLDADSMVDSILTDTECYVSPVCQWHPKHSDVMATFHKTCLYLVSKQKLED